MGQFLLHVLVVVLTAFFNYVAVFMTCEPFIDSGLFGTPWMVVILLPISAAIGSFFHLLLETYPIRSRITMGAVVGVICLTIILLRLPAPQF